MANDKFINLQNCSFVKVEKIPVLEIVAFREALISSCGKGARIASLFGSPSDGGETRLFAVISDWKNGSIKMTSTVVRNSYPSITPECPQASIFEREIAEKWAVVPEGHPDFKPLRYHPAYREGKDAWNRNPDEIKPGSRKFHRITGEEIHEVAVGPVHAGIIEPGHFRFQCHGEEVFNLEISLGYQHRGVEKALVGGPSLKTIHFMETLAGDTSIGHSMAYCQIVEVLSGINPSSRAHSLRGIMLELERIANHTGDLGALANDIAYLPTSSYCGRIRGDYLNMTAMICGNRFGRNMIRPGGVEHDIDDNLCAMLLEKLTETFKDTQSAVELLWDSSSALSRFEDCGKLQPEICRQLGVVGPAARACGLEMDVRFDFPSGVYRFCQIPVSNYYTGDVFARAYVRWLEIKSSVNFITEILKGLPPGELTKENPGMYPDSVAVSFIEGWRGEICHVALTDGNGSFKTYKIVDPSFHNWAALENVMKNEEISNFPVCNKSFNLSYCGNDL